MKRPLKRGSRQHEVLKVLAKHPDGLTFSKLENAMPKRSMHKRWPSWRLSVATYNLLGTGKVIRCTYHTDPQTGERFGSPYSGWAITPKGQHALAAMRGERMRKLYYQVYK